MTVATSSASASETMRCYASRIAASYLLTPMHRYRLTAILITNAILCVPLFLAWCWQLPFGSIARLSWSLFFLANRLRHGRGWVPGWRTGAIAWTTRSAIGIGLLAMLPMSIARREGPVG